MEGLDRAAKAMYISIYNSRNYMEGLDLHKVALKHCDLQQ